MLHRKPKNSIRPFGSISGQRLGFCWSPEMSQCVLEQIEMDRIQANRVGRSLGRHIFIYI